MSTGSGIEAGARALTPQRQVVLQVVRGTEAHLTAAEIYDGARQLLPSISFATVYNSLRYLRDEGLISEVTFGNSASRYDRETSRHDHAVCTSCGRLTDFDLDETAALLKLAARRSKFKAQSVHLTLYGLCPDCGAKR